MPSKSELALANKAKKDEFYTQLSDIEKEMRYYRKHFKDKTVFCNCDDPFESNFFKYFVLNFNRLGLKKLIATCYASSPIANTQLSLFDVIGTEESKQNKPYKAVVTKVYDKTGDGGIDMFDVAELFKSGENSLSELEGDGDFRSNECLELLDKSDIVVTNPPFSLFREYMAQLIEYKKKFVIIGNKNSITYKEIFALIKEEKIWLGYRNVNSDMWFVVPPGYRYEKIVEGQKLKHIMGCWYTNLDTTKRHEVMPLYKKYSAEEYPEYDNYKAINVDKVSDIPYDYDGVMGVPITFLDKYNPEQFEIIGLAPERNKQGESILQIKRYENAIQYNKDGSTNKGSKVNDGPVIIHDVFFGKYPYYKSETLPNKYLEVLYARILIRRK